MNCPKCGIECVISGSRNEGCREESGEVKIETVQELSCRNPSCEGFGQVQGEARHLIYRGTPREN